MNANTSAGDGFDQVREILWGGPANPNKGLVFLVEELAQASKRHGRVLFGENGSAGLVDTVRTHERIVARVEKALIWLLSIVGTEALALIGYVLWQAVRSAP